ncbi:lysozyme inhibitor LprI family protein [Achromobacter sp. DH1f]|uniref:lysozyme inhibitor LprI family protein n=1 Tax=Achromobacter sp. DH1f TaxID=1397275 RepID=UPI001E58B380|nr:lysozyme inhibitor LprI family protein [Achromobacter sp. DH1f]
MTQPHSTRSPAYALKIRSTAAMKLLLTLGLATLWTGAQAASFDCNKAVSTTERLICSDAETSALDGKLQGAYETAQAATDAYGKKALAKEQRNWIKYARDMCQDIACLQQAYTARIAMLARNEKHIANGEVYSDCKLPGNQTASGECVNVVPIRDPNARVESFNQSLAHQKQKGRIIGCSQLIDLPVGVAGSNHSFGGSCVLQEGAQRKNVRICNDDMFGHFQVEPSTPQDASDKRLVDFTYAQCYGG